METDDEFMYLAPEAGYATEVGFQFKESDAEWTYRIRKKFFVQTHNGQHIARINVEVFAHYDNEAVFSVDYAVNTNGSRSLE